MYALEPRTVDNSGEIVDQLRERLGPSLKTLSQLKPPEGISTGVAPLDHFLLWRGIPKGDISLFLGQPGTGATSLWLHTVREIHKQDRWAAWINSEWRLVPGALLARGLNLERLLVVDRPEKKEDLFCILQEMISSSLFELIGCHLPEALLKNHQLKKLKNLARLHKVALVFVSHVRNWRMNSLFGLVIECDRDRITVKRALHRPVPFSVAGSAVLADMRPDLLVLPRPLAR